MSSLAAQRPLLGAGHHLDNDTLEEYAEADCLTQFFGDKVNDVSPDGKRGGGGSDNNTNPITTDVPVNTYLFAVKTYFTEKRNNIRALFSMGVRL